MRADGHASQLGWHSDRAAIESRASRIVAARTTLGAHQAFFRLPLVRDQEKTGFSLGTICLPAVLLFFLVQACEAPSRNPGASPDSAALETEAPADTPTPLEDPLFLDVAEASGLDFTHWNGMSGAFYYAEMMGSGAALLDYDNDGDLDVYLVQGNRLGPPDSTEDTVFPPPDELPLSDRLYRNDSTGGSAPSLRFTDVTQASGIAPGGYGMGVTAADFDGDGWIDLYITNLHGNRMLRNSGGPSPTFEDVTTKSGTGSKGWSVPAVAFDYNRDGRLDLFIGRYVEYSVKANKRCTDELGVPNYCGPLAFAPLPDQLLRNRGDGTFEDVTQRMGLGEEFGGCLGAVASDFDDDGWIDLYVANDGMPNQLWINQEGNGFENRALLAGVAVSGQGHPEASMGVAAADFDRDGDEDLFLTHLSRETNTLYVNDGRGLFLDRSATSGLGAPSFSRTGFGTGWLDYDNDGWIDLMSVNGAVKVIKTLSLAGDPLPLHQTNQLFHATGDGTTFEDVTARAGPDFELSEVSRGAAFGDIDNDGDTDVLINNNSGSARLLINQIGQDQGWVGLRLMDRPGKRDMLGARAGIVRDQGIVWRRIGSTASYASSNDPRLLFGLGRDSVFAGVVVQWPNGRFEHWTSEQVPTRTYTVLRKGTGRPWDGKTENGETE